MPLVADDPLPPGLAEVGNRALERASGAPASAGNAVKLLLDAEQNFPAWHEAIQHAERTVFFESYIFADDDVGRMFAETLAARARKGVYVCVVYDWLGSSRMHALAAMMRGSAVPTMVWSRAASSTTRTSPVSVPISCGRVRRIKPEVRKVSTAAAIFRLYATEFA